MKWSKQWVAALLLAPGMFLASCGGSGNNNEGSDTLTTQSAPPADVNSSTSDTRNMGDSATRAGDGGTNSASGNTNQTTTSPGNEATTGTGSTTGTTGTGTSGSGSSESTVRTRSGEKARSFSATKRKSSGYTSRTRRSTARGTTGEKTTDRSSLDRSADNTRSDVDADSSTTSMNRHSAMDSSKSMRHSMDTSSSMRRSMDTTSSRTRSGINRMDSTAREDMGNVDSSGMNMNRSMDSSWKRSSISTGDSAPSTLDSTRGAKGNISGYPGRTTTGRDTTDPSGDTTSSTTGQGNMGITSTTGTGMNFTPSAFIRTQIENNYGEIKMARLAIDQASSSDVKNIARILENDHNQALRELQTLARNQADLSGSLPTSESDSAKQHISMMRNSRGSDFDRTWVSHMHAMHEQGVRNFEMAENTITDTNLKNWVSKMLPKLRDHRDRLAQLERNLSK